MTPAKGAGSVGREQRTERRRRPPHLSSRLLTDALPSVCLPQRGRSLNSYGGMRTVLCGSSAMTARDVPLGGGMVKEDWRCNASSHGYVLTRRAGC